MIGLLPSYILIQYISKVQHDATGEARPKITIPKRGEKDFEPLAETVNLQEMMLQRSREALFGALQGVRGTNSSVPTSDVVKLLTNIQ